MLKFTGSTVVYDLILAGDLLGSRDMFEEEDEQGWIEKVGFSSDDEGMVISSRLIVRLDDEKIFLYT